VRTDKICGRNLSSKIPVDMNSVFMKLSVTCPTWSKGHIPQLFEFAKWFYYSQCDILLKHAWMVDNLSTAATINNYMNTFKTLKRLYEGNRLFWVDVCLATYAISAYHYWGCGFESRSGRGVQHYVMKFVNELRQVGGFLRVLRFRPPIKLTAMI
jgi:hypothetical protein